MLFWSKGFLYPLYINVSKRFVSNEIKGILNTRLDPLSGTIGNQLQFGVVSKNLNALNLDLFVNNLNKHEDSSSDVLNLVANLRTTKLANTCLESTHFAVVRHLLENLSIQEVVPVLLDRPKYGIFLNNFTAFAVFQTLHKEKEYILGLPLAMKLVLAAEIDSVFIQGFCLKASLETLKRKLYDNQPCDDKNINSPKGKVKEKKIRVKFIRNVYEPDTHNEIGKSMLKIDCKAFERNYKMNIDILGFVLTKNYAELDTALSFKSVEICVDIADICKKLLLKENQTDFANKIDNLQSKSSFENFIDTFLKEVSVKEVDALAEEQKQQLPIWQQQRLQMKSELDNEITKQERRSNIEELRNEIETQKDLLWFFENEDKLDLEIQKKQIFYPKRWFGKKKKPRVVDEHYIPPQVRKIN